MPMSDLGDTVSGETYAFDFRTLEPRPEAPTALLVLLHGVGGDEEQLAGLGSRAPGGTLVVLPRGQRSISGDRLGWYREGLSEDGPQVVLEEADEALAKLVDFIATLQKRFDVSPSRTVVAGFSQGGCVAAGAALTAPSRVAAFAMLCGRLLPEIGPALPPADTLAHLRALVVHGRDDDVLPVDWADRAADWLARLGIAHEVRLHDAGHELTPGMEADFVAWLRGVLSAPVGSRKA